MPTYEYRCTSCGTHVEVFQRLDAEALRTCERCGGALRKVFHPAGIVFKGSGFYATDSRGKKAAQDGAKPDGSTKESKTGAEPVEKKEKKAAAGESAP